MMKALIQKYFYSIEWLLLSVMLVVLPSVFSRKLLDPVFYSRNLYLGIFLLIILIIVGYKIYKGQFRLSFNRSETYVFGALLMFVLLHVLSSFGAINDKEAVVQTLKEFSFAMYFFLIYFQLKNKPEGRNLIIKSVIVMVGLFLIIGLVQLFKSDYSPFKNATNNLSYYFRLSTESVKSTLASKNPFSSLLFLTLPFSVYGVLFFKKIWRVGSLIVVILSVAFISLLMSKAVWGALALAFLIIFVLSYIYLFAFYPKQSGKVLPMWIKVILIIFPFVLGGSGFYMVKKTEVKIVKVVVDRAQQVLSPELCLNGIYNSDKPTSTQTRMLVWAQSLQMAKDNPVLGVGPGSWRLAIPEYGLDGYEIDIRNGKKHFQRPHNDFLWIASEVGFAGLLLFLFLYIYMLVVAVLNMIRNSDVKERVFGALSFSVLVAYLIILFVSFSRERIAHNLVYLLIFSILLFDKKVTTEKARNLKKNYGVLAFVVLVVLAIFNLNVVAQVVKGESLALDIIKYNRTKNWNRIVRLVDINKGSYYTLDPFSTPLTYYQGVAYSASKHMEQAKVSFADALNYHPNHIQLLNNLATSYDLTGNANKAEEIYLKAVAISPKFYEAQLNLAIVYYNQDKMDKSLSHLKNIPYNTKVKPQKFKRAVLAVMRKKAASMQSVSNIEKLKLWFKNENKIVQNFVSFQEEGQPINQILLEEFGK